MNAATITRQSKSNLALAFISLGRERKRDMTVFYAFCRVIDDIADSSELSVAEKQKHLTAWREMLRTAVQDEPALARDVRGLMNKYSLSPEMLEEIIAGVGMDLSIFQYATFQDLRVYCYRVASAVGLVSIEIFGYRNPRFVMLAKICRSAEFICRRRIWRAATIPRPSCVIDSTTSGSFA